MHTNTDHPHVHVAVRGVTRAGREVRFDREFIKDGFRFHAEKLATQKLGFRSERDIQAAMVKEISQDRVTSLDRQIARVRPKQEVRQQPASGYGWMIHNLPATCVRMWFMLLRWSDDTASFHHGTGKACREKEWEVQAGFLKTLRTVQAVGDKQKMMARHMEAASDVNLPVVFAQWKDIELLQGRVLGHGGESGREWNSPQSAQRQRPPVPQRSVQERRLNSIRVSKTFLVLSWPIPSGTNYQENSAFQNFAWVSGRSCGRSSNNGTGDAAGPRALKSNRVCSCPSGCCSRHSSKSSGGISESTTFVRCTFA